LPVTPSPLWLLDCPTFPGKVTGRKALRSSPSAWSCPVCTPVVSSFPVSDSSDRSAPVTHVD